MFRKEQKSFKAVCLPYLFGELAPCGDCLFRLPSSWCHLRDFWSLSAFLGERLFPQDNYFSSGTIFLLFSSSLKNLHQLSSNTIFPVYIWTFVRQCAFAWLKITKKYKYKVISNFLRKSNFHCHICMKIHKENQSGSEIYNAKHKPYLQKCVLVAFINIFHVCSLSFGDNACTLLCLFIIHKFSYWMVEDFGKWQTPPELCLCSCPAALLIQLLMFCMKTCVRAGKAMQLSYNWC